MKNNMVSFGAWLVLALATLTVGPATGTTRADDPAPRERLERRLTVYTFRTPGICPACDAVRPITTRMARRYPLEFVYRDDPDGLVRCLAAGVDRFPTFVLTQTRPDGASQELLRWSGAHDLERRIQAAQRLTQRLGSQYAPERP